MGSLATEEAREGACLAAAADGRPQLPMAAEGWEDVAASIDSWLDGVLAAPDPAQQPVGA
jgi:hypothetical protein